MGRKQVKDDFAKAVSLFTQPNSNIKGLEYDGETVSFSFEGGGKSLHFTLGIDDSYPENSLLFPSDGDPVNYSVVLPKVLENVSQVYCKKFGIKYEPPKETAPAPTPTPTPAVAPAVVASKREESHDHDEDGDDEDEEDVEVEEEKSPLLVEDLATVRAAGHNVTFREYQSLDLLDIELHIQAEFIDARLANAWGLTHGQPLTVRVSVSPSMYVTSSTLPKIEVLQCNARCGLSTQLTQILKAFLEQHWAKFGHTKRETQTTTPAPHNSNKHPVTTKHTQTLPSKKDKKEVLPAGITEKQVTTLINMGFHREKSIRALAASAGDIEQASHYLVEDESEKIAQDRADKSLRTDLFEQEKLIQSQKKYDPNYADGVLLQICKYVSFRLPTVNKYCVICDGNHLFAGGDCLLRPAVCARELCCFAFQALGVMSDAAVGVATQILEPFPTFCDPDDHSKVVLSSSKKDFGLLCDIFAVFPSIEDVMVAQEVKAMKAHLDTAHKFAFPLLQWIINSNRSHIEKLPANRHVKSMGTPFQYVLMSAPPEKEQEFSQLKAKHGTIFAFHGSPVENWHCILRTGLRNASGTKLQLHGAAYGNGIYLSPLAQTSFGYAARSYFAPQQTQATASPSGKSRYLGSTNFHCVALCEVINTNTITKNNSIWVCPNETHVITRFFFVFPPNSGAVSPSANTETETFLSEVRAALERD